MQFSFRPYAVRTGSRGTQVGREREDPVLTEYARLAGQYDRRWSFYVDATTRETLKRLCSHPGDALLDVGCGTGTFLQALASAFPSAKLTGVDPSPAMLDIARAKLGPAAELKPGRAESLPFLDETFDVVVSTSTFHYLRRPGKALREIARVLKPGGEIVITDWCHDYLACHVYDLILRCFNRAHFRTHGRDECRRLLEGSKFQSIDIERYKINWLWGLMTAKAQKRAA